jgi:D-alanyl-D-alanine carboxypeptidase/D-alanyl-D-alanine-endopeptidase (penicillin-binding protein 4)
MTQKAATISPVLKQSAIPVLLLLLAAGAAYMGIRANDAAEQPVIAATESIDAVSTPLFSARRTPEVLREPAADELLARELDQLAASLPSDACLVAAQADRTIYSHNATLPVVPASTQKLLTAAAALDLLGPNYRFTTQVLSSAPPIDGVIDGSIFVVGGGDPVLDADTYLSRYDPPIPNTDFEALAFSLIEQGIVEVTGDFVGDPGRYDDVRYVESFEAKPQLEVPYADGWPPKKKL